MSYVQWARTSNVGKSCGGPSALEIGKLSVGIRGRPARRKRSSGRKGGSSLTPTARLVRQMRNRLAMPWRSCGYTLQEGLAGITAARNLEAADGPQGAWKLSNSASPEGPRVRRPGPSLRGGLPEGINGATEARRNCAIVAVASSGG
ncbi:hypothetical protein MRX96_030928 [Rhipicephalus microplus]